MDTGTEATLAAETPADALAREAMAAFDRVVDGQMGFRSRPGQRQMAERVAHTFSQADLGLQREGSTASAADGDGEVTAPQRRLSVIQAGTGVGKSLAYSAPAVALALARGTRVLISTATVALQEQLVHKDLPALAAVLPQPFRFALAKGRGRYVCLLKLERQASPESAEPDDLFADDPPLAPSGNSSFVADNPTISSEKGYFDEQLTARRGAWKAMADALATGTWDGDRDNLPTAPEGDVWQPIAAEAASCTGKHCPLFSRCTYFERRKELVGAQVIVANHDLLLSSLGSRVLPELDHCLLVLDEAHHLPGVALDQFTRSMDLTRLRWIDQLAQRATQVGAALYLSDALDGPKLAAELRRALQELARAVLDTLRPGAGADSVAGGHGALRGGSAGGTGGVRGAREGFQSKSAVGAYGSSTRSSPFRSLEDRVRLPQGQLPDALVPALDAVVAAADAWLVHLAAMAKTLKADIKDKPEDARRLSNLYAQMGTLAPRLEAVADTAHLLLSGLEEGDAPVAKWFTFHAASDALNPVLHIRAHACPTLPGTVLRQHLWPRVRAVVLTSATLTSLGRFDFFMAESGLAQEPDASALEVPSPFDFAAQGCFEVVHTRTDPREAAAFTAEMVALLLADLVTLQDQTPGGALVLFTSRDQLRQAVAALPDRLRPYVLVQGELPRTALLQRHRQQVGQGEMSVIFGMQSFGEGLDLPGALCAHLFIAKLPFAPPDDPVGEARAEWLEAQGRNPFMELTVPATSVRLAQWAGRAIRTETDQAHIVCYDRRLLTTPYGQRLLQGLPPFAQTRRQG
ncbi:MAG: ATP-dependent DNA helicase DinG [Burkholderiaceae bacterium]|nr:ATP-dependent DNA helicase DinG [Burkholderiaceae bacterium]